MAEEHIEQQLREEHAHISGVAGRKVFNMDSDGNIINYSGVTVYQGTQPFNSLGTVTLAANDVTVNSGVTVFQGSQPWNSMATVDIGTNNSVKITDGTDTALIDDDGHLQVSDNHSGLAIAMGEVTGTTFIHKFGAAEDFDIADGFITVWDGAEDDEAYEAMNATYSTTDDITTIVAQDAGDSQDVEIQGLDGSWDLVVQTKALNGQTPVALDTPLVRVFRMKNVGSVNLTSHAFALVSGASIASGVAQDGTEVRGVIHADNNQTEMAMFTIPNGKTGYMRSWYASTAGAKKDSSHTIKLLARPFGQVFQLKHKANIDVDGTSYIQHEYVEPEVFSAKTDIEMQMDTDTDIAGVAGGFDIVLVDD